MPHVIIKSWPGKKEEDKKELAAGIVRLVQETLKVPETSVSVSYEEIPQEDWFEKAYRPDILEKADTLYVKPGYVPRELQKENK